MATRLYSVTVSDQLGYSNVTEAVGSATTTSAIELTVDLAASPAPARQDVVNALEIFKAYILAGNWPPA